MARRGGPSIEPDNQPGACGLIKCKPRWEKATSSRPKNREQITADRCATDRIVTIGAGGVERQREGNVVNDFERILEILNSCESSYPCGSVNSCENRFLDASRYDLVEMFRLAE